MTKTHTLLFREIDKEIFEAIKSGGKTIESRAATEKYKAIKKGDILNFVCGSDSLQKSVTKVRLFSTIEEMASKLDVKKIMPFVNSLGEMRQVYFSFPNYKNKIDKFGIIVFELR